jgi:hypothetical protein
LANHSHHHKLNQILPFFVGDALGLSSICSRTVLAVEALSGSWDKLCNCNRGIAASTYIEALHTSHKYCVLRPCSTSPHEYILIPLWKKRIHVLGKQKKRCLLCQTTVLDLLGVLGSP